MGNDVGGRSADSNLRLSLLWRPAAMIGSLLAVGLVATQKWPFLAAAFVFDIASFREARLGRLVDRERRVLAFAPTRRSHRVQPSAVLIGHRY